MSPLAVHHYQNTEMRLHIQYRLHRKADGTKIQPTEQKCLN